MSKSSKSCLEVKSGPDSGQKHYRIAMGWNRKLGAGQLLTLSFI